MSLARSTGASRVAPLLALVLAFGAGTACSTSEGSTLKGPDAAEIARRSTQFEKALSAPDSEQQAGGAIARWLLPDKLKEISGLTLTDDGRLLGHGDSRGNVFEVDYRRGVLVKEFALIKDEHAVKADFEGITVANGSVVLLSSDGQIYQFKEGADGENVQFTLADPGLKAVCEFEGVAFDKAINSLLLACKHVHDKSLKDSLVIFRWKLEGDSAKRLSRLTVPLALAIGDNKWDGLHPSDITLDPFNGNYVLISSWERALVEITPAGKVVFSRSIPGKHDQAEGIAITKDSLLIISDEAGKVEKNAAKKTADSAAHQHRVPDDSVHRQAVITVYRWP